MLLVCLFWLNVNSGLDRRVTTVSVINCFVVYCYSSRVLFFIESNVFELWSLWPFLNYSLESANQVFFS